jgi:hypothetical protein
MTASGTVRMPGMAGMMIVRPVTSSMRQHWS